MYVEKQSFKNRYKQWAQWGCTAFVLWQVVALLGTETGLAWLPLGYATHLLVLICALAGLALCSRAGLSLRISPKGWGLRFSPYQFYHRHIGWGEIKKVRFLKPSELPQGWRPGVPERTFAHAFLISNPRYDVACIELTSGYQVFVSIQKPKELIEFLHKHLLQLDLKKKLLV